MPFRALLSILLLSFASTVAAQNLKSYFGPTIGISIPDFGHPDEERPRALGVTIERRSPIPSPIVGANAGITFNKHIAIDAALQYSYTGQRYSWETIRPRLAHRFYREQLWMHNAALPVTIGYAGNVRRTHIRLGVGGSFRCLLAARTVVNQSAVDGEPLPERSHNTTGAIVLVYGRLQVHPRASMSVTFSGRLMISAAYTRGKIREGYHIGFPGSEASMPRNSAIDLTATYLIRKLAARRQVPDTVPTE